MDGRAGDAHEKAVSRPFSPVRRYRSLSSKRLGKTYIRNHPLSDPGDYEDNFDRSTEYITQVQERLDELAEMIYSPEHCSPHGLSYDDIVLFPRLRTLTIVKGLVLPKRLREYVEFQAAAAEIPVYDYCAI
ncbi:Glutaredoxin 2 [Gracilariopsis chorda]|uniref:Glutaredoxin 2 n=1 Tax=Gracilariopsis chorda TaxID=448386 RepID=A0A2V3IC07_9FLOR|nr:Glutaredoxin 2 [Gracilariopsis chorda]|eukprot:PXF39578.1 Glutaredoxin 2 [Gracilariopsis chorda]